MATQIGVSANTGSGGTMGNPGLREDGTVQGLSAPPPATTTTAAVTPEPMRPAQAAMEDRLPKSITPRDQAISTGADPERYGDTPPTATAQLPLAKSSAALMNAVGARRTG